MDTATTYRACPACSGTSAKHLPLYSPDPWHIATCDGCDMTYLRNPPVYKALEEDYAWERTYEDKKAKSKGSTFLSPHIRAIRNKLGMYRDKTKSFRKWFGDGHVLDIGSGWGQRITAPMTPFGIELSNALFQISDEKMRASGGFCLHGAGAEVIWDFDEGQFDGVVMFSYLEHETDVLGVLRGAHRALNKAGGVFIRVPNFGSLNRRVIGKKWCGFRYPDHVNYFTLATLKDVARRSGFVTTLINSVTLPIDDNISVLLRKSGVSA